MRLMTKAKATAQIIAICKRMKWDYWFDNEGKLIIDVDGALQIAE